MTVERRGQAIRVMVNLANWQQEEPNGYGGERQLSMDGTSRVTGDSHARFCERLGVKFPGATRRRSVTDVPTATGDGVVVYGLRGRSSNRQIDCNTQARAVKLRRQPEWHDFGPTSASEQLAKRHGILVSKETACAWMVSAGLWKSAAEQAQRGASVAATAPRRRRTGALGHLEPRLTGRAWRTGALPGADGMIDNATSQSEGCFVRLDGTRENMGVRGSMWTAKAV
jgi:hypothetical protein